MAADGTTYTEPTLGPNLDDLTGFAAPYEQDAGTFATEAVDEFADVFELMRFVVSEAGNLQDDKTLRLALERTLFRAQRRAEIVSGVVHSYEWAAARATNPNIDPYAGRKSAAHIYSGKLPPSFVQDFKTLRVPGGETMCSHEWLRVGRMMVDAYRELEDLATATTCPECTAVRKPAAADDGEAAEAVDGG